VLVLFQTTNKHKRTGTYIVKASVNVAVCVSTFVCVITTFCVSVEASSVRVLNCVLVSVCRTGGGVSVTTSVVTCVTTCAGSVSVLVASSVSVDSTAGRVGAVRVEISVAIVVAVVIDTGRVSVIAGSVSVTAGSVTAGRVCVTAGSVSVTAGNVTAGKVVVTKTVPSTVIVVGRGTESVVMRVSGWVKVLVLYTCQQLVSWLAASLHASNKKQKAKKHEHEHDHDAVGGLSRDVSCRDRLLVSMVQMVESESRCILGPDVNLSKSTKSVSTRTKNQHLFELDSCRLYIPTRYPIV
jgi:hypothetical protein